MDANGPRESDSADRHLYDKAMRGKGVLLSMTDCYRHKEYDEPIVALKALIYPELRAYAG